MKSSELVSTQKEQGFTLIELLVVVVIIGILAAVAIPSFMNQRQRANDAAVESDVHNIATEVETMLISEPNATNITVKSLKGGSTTPLVAVIGLNASVPARDYASITVGAQNQNVPLSESVVVKGEGNAAGFILKGAHKNGGSYTYSDQPEAISNWLVYDSVNGGLQLETSAEEAVSAEDALLMACQEAYNEACAELDLKAFDAFTTKWIAANDPGKTVDNISMSYRGTVSFTTNGGRSTVGTSTFNLPTGYTGFSVIQFRVANERITMTTPEGIYSADVRVYANYPLADAKEEAAEFRTWAKANAPEHTTSAKYEKGKVTFSVNPPGGSNTKKTVDYPQGFAKGAEYLRFVTYDFNYDSMQVSFRGVSERGKSYPTASYNFDY